MNVTRDCSKVWAFDAGEDTMIFIPLVERKVCHMSLSLVPKQHRLIWIETEICGCLAVRTYLTPARDLSNTLSQA